MEKNQEEIIREINIYKDCRKDFVNDIIIIKFNSRIFLKQNGAKV